MPAPLTRRAALRTLAGSAAAVSIGPVFARTADKAGTKPVTVGSGGHVYECHHGWGETPDGFAWGNTHGVCQSADGTIFVTHQATGGPERDAILAFDPEGQFLRSFGREFHGGGHGIDLRVEDGTEYLYESDVAHGVVAKLTTDGEEVWRVTAPEQPEIYRGLGAPAGTGGKFVPTNVAFAPDGGLFVADGYGMSVIHRYTNDGGYLSTFTRKGGGPGETNTPHSIYWDDRPGRTPALAVADRGNSRIDYFSANGEFLRVEAAGAVALPCDLDPRGGLFVVPDLNARVTLLDAENRLVTHLGHDEEWRDETLADNRAIRNRPDRWRPGRFVTPHDAAFVNGDDLLVAEWVPTGRLTYLRRV